MANSYIQVPPDSTGKKLFTVDHTVDASLVQVQVMHASDPVTPTHIQRVDSRGAASVRFAEGAPTLDAFNNLRIGESTIIAGYEYTNGDMADLFTDETATGGTITHVPTSSETHFDCNTTSGASCIRTSNRYHYYQPGVGNMAIFTLALSDAGRANNVRRWGYFDENDGVFFELNGTDWNVVIRSSVSGSVVEQRISQPSWNGDPLDGTGPSGMTVDPTKANFYWLDFAWLGVGIVRFGLLAPDGSRWPIHTFENPNSNNNAYMRSGSLPIRFENYNTGVTGGTSTIRSICTAVYSESSTDYTFWRFADIERLTPVTVTTNTPVLSMRVKAGSRVGIYPEQLSVFVAGGAVKFTIVDDATLTGATWAIVGGGEAEGDIAATSASGGDVFHTCYADEGVTNIKMDQCYETNDEGYHRLADDSDSYTFTVLATKLSGTSVTVAATLNYKELR